MNTGWTDAEKLLYLEFVREELGVLVDFLGDTLIEGKNLIIGVRGMPRVGKTTRGNPWHWELLAQVLDNPTPKIIEHPDIFIRDGKLKVTFDLVIEIRNSVDDVIRAEDVDLSFSAFDLS